MQNLNLLAIILFSNANTTLQIRKANKNSQVKLTSMLMTCFLIIGIVLISIQPVSAEASNMNISESLLPILNSNLENEEEQNKAIIPFKNIERDKLSLDTESIYWCPGEDLDIPIRGISDEYQNIEISILLESSGVLLTSSEIIKKDENTHTVRFLNIDKYIKAGEKIRLGVSKYFPSGSSEPTFLFTESTITTILQSPTCK